LLKLKFFFLMYLGVSFRAVVSLALAWDSTVVFVSVCTGAGVTGGAGWGAGVFDTLAAVVFVFLAAGGWTFGGGFFELEAVGVVFGGAFELVGFAWAGLGAVFSLSALFADFGFSDWACFSAAFKASFHQVWSLV